MAALDKLIDLLEQIKQTDPSFSEKASRALDVLIEEDPAETSTVFKGGTIKDGKLVTKLEKKEPAPEPAPEPVPEVIEYPSEVEISDENLQEIRSRQHIISMEIARLGLLQQNYESDKELLLELIEENQKSLQTFLQSLQESYNLDVKATYVLNLPPDGKQKASFIKRESN
jgi:hypothetical protein